MESGVVFGLVSGLLPGEGEGKELYGSMVNLELIWLVYSERGLYRSLGPDPGQKRYLSVDQ